MIGDALRTTVLSLRIIPNPEDFLLRALNVPEGHRSLGLITTDCDDVSYAALDEATKKAEVSVVYAKTYKICRDKNGTEIERIANQ